MLISTRTLEIAPAPVEGEVTLSGQRFRFRLAFNARTEGWPLLGEPDGAWYADIFTADGTALVLRRLLRVVDDLWALFESIVGMPLGTLRIFRQAGGDALPKLTEIGTVVLIDYADPASSE